MTLAAQSVGLDLSQHRARRIDDLPTLDDFDLIFTMERGQKEALQVEFPHLRQRIRMLSALAGPPYDIDDPLGRTPQHYLITLHEIERLLEAGLPKLLAWLPNQPGSST
jgi:protein-tyrosine phosphatase